MVEPARLTIRMRWAIGTSPQELVADVSGGDVGSQRVVGVSSFDGFLAAPGQAGGAAFGIGVRRRRRREQRSLTALLVTTWERQRRLAGVEDMVMSLSARGLTTGEIAAHLAAVHGAQVSKQTISTITEKVMDGMAEWRTVRWTRCIRWCSSTRST